MVVGDFSIHAETMVIGGGPGGYVAAIRAAQLGQDVTLVERDTLGGVCLNVGCIPSKALIGVSQEYYQAKQNNHNGIAYKDVTIDMKETQVWKTNSVVNALTSGIGALLKKNKVKVVYGEALFTGSNRLRVINGDEGETYTFKNVIVATGSRPIEIPNFKFEGRVLDSTGALALDHVPKSMVIVGGGYIGSELAGVYANLGTKITILEGSDSILPTFSRDLVKEVENNFKTKGVEIITGVNASNVTQSDKGVEVVYNDTSIKADYVLVTVGRRPNTDNMGLEYAGVKLDERGLIIVDDQGQSNVKGIYAIGDVTAGLQLAHKASYEGKVVAESISGHAVGFDYTVIPAVSFTDPEIAVVGITLKEAQEHNAKAYTFPLQANGRALSMNNTQGFVRLLVENESKAILGAEMVGAHASELIAEVTMAIEAQLTVEDISLIIHAHPTLSESIMDASELALGLPIHI